MPSPEQFDQECANFLNDLEHYQDAPRRAVQDLVEEERGRAAQLVDLEDIPDLPPWMTDHKLEQCESAGWILRYLPAMDSVPFDGQLQKLVKQDAVSEPGWYMVMNEPVSGQEVMLYILDQRLSRAFDLDDTVSLMPKPKTGVDYCSTLEEMTHVAPDFSEAMVRLPSVAEILYLRMSCPSQIPETNTLCLNKPGDSEGVNVFFKKPHIWFRSVELTLPYRGTILPMRRIGTATVSGTA